MDERKVLLQFSSLKTPLISSSRKIRSEWDVTVHLLWPNAIAFLFIFIGGLLVRVISTPFTIAETAPLAIKTIVVGVFCGFVFDIANQTMSPQEDNVNKPYRPIPAGLISARQRLAGC
jgi:4-hydroxybenzoate polyprenyltransferase